MVEQFVPLAVSYEEAKQWVPILRVSLGDDTDFWWRDKHLRLWRVRKRFRYLGERCNQVHHWIRRFLPRAVNPPACWHPEPRRSRQEARRGWRVLQIARYWLRYHAWLLCLRRSYQDVEQHRGFRAEQVLFCFG